MSGIRVGGRPSIVSSMPHGLGHAPATQVPMKLFATWEVESTPPNCIPRLCSLTISRLALVNTLDSDLTSIIIAVKMQSSKRTLRSNEIPLPTTGLLDTELELAFSLQYPHFIKGEGSTLQIMLQKRKKYKNRTILGYKTLAVGLINMSQVLQRQMDLELELLVEGKEGGWAVLGKVNVLSLSSQPVDHEELQKQAGGSERGLVDCYSDDEDYSSLDEGSDIEHMTEGIRNPVRRMSAKGLSNSAARQRNLRQKFVSLLRRFKVNEPEDLRALKDNPEGSSQVNDVDAEEIEDLLNELEDFSDYGPDIDTISVASVPKPSLRPFFSSSQSLIREALDNQGTQKSRYSILEPTEKGPDHMSDDSSKGAMSDSHTERENMPDPEHLRDPVGMTSSPHQSGDELKVGKEKDKPDRKLFNKENYREAGNLVLDRLSQSIKAKSGSSGGRDAKESVLAHGCNKDQLEKMNSTNNIEGSSPRKVLLEQLSRILPADDRLPDQVILANIGDPQASHLASKLSCAGSKVICTAGPADVRATLTCLVTRLQKYCNTNIAPPQVMKVGLCGSDSFLNCMLRPYVELFSSKPPDWQNHILFYVIPLGYNSVSRGLAARCPIYSKLFHDDSWKELLEKPEPTKTEVDEIVGRVSQYLALEFNWSLSIAEAMVTYKHKDEESCQSFIPFLSDVKVGAFSEAESEDYCHERKSDCPSPPRSPTISKQNEFNMKPVDEELLELQLDYWGMLGERNDKQAVTKTENERKQDAEKSKKQTNPKSSIKTQFRSLSVHHIPSDFPDSQRSFSMSYTTKEKKPKAVLKIGKKKEKSGDTDSKCQSIEGISRLICMTKSNHPLKVSIDGNEWAGVKFFQLSSQWQTHIKYLPVAVGTGSD